MSEIEVKVLKEEDRILEMEVRGIDIALMEQLVKTLSSQKDVVFAAYKKVHPLVSHPVLVVKTQRAKAKNAVKKALEEMKKYWEDVAKQAEA